ncbi:MAG: tetratricopeptide repeat protein [Terracidiphilus sp.]|jgi:tetratricopeptide (TPR) repeat protein
MRSFRLKSVLLLASVLLTVTAVYSNHFHNSFHFDDSHAAVDNPYIRNLRNVPRFFWDATTFSVLPANRTYRPFVSASLALDYALARGYNTFWFHFSTFLIFLLQLIAMYAVFTAILGKVRPQVEAHNINRNVSLLAVAWYGLHPAMAETVNYIIQRGDVFCTFGVVSALAFYARFPALRKTGLYLLPFAFALLSKPPAMVFPFFLFMYIAMFERDGGGGNRGAALAALPSVVVCALLMGLQAVMTPKTYMPATISAYSYRITQPFVLMRYFGSLFLPLHLNVDTDLQPFPSLTPLALLGFLFVALLVAAAWITGQRRTTCPISFGLLWFLIASLPTSLYRLSEVENDHRMFLPFVGLVLAVVWAAYLVVDGWATRKKRGTILRASSAVAILLLSLYAYGAHLRNQVWRTDESLWLDDVEKSPHNGRGLMNYGLTQMAKGAYPVALDYFQRALLYTPNYASLEINLGIVHGAMNQATEAEQHFQRAIDFAPADDEAHFFYGRWLYQSGRIADALPQLETAGRLNPSRLSTLDLLASAYAIAGDTEKAHDTAMMALSLAPFDTTAKNILSAPAQRSADYWINASLYQYQAENYEACIQDAKLALEVKPDSELAYNNIGAAYAGLHQWDLAIENEREALHIKPNFTLASNNLALYSHEKAAQTSQSPQNMTADDWLNASLEDNHSGQYLKSIEDARTALRIRPDYAEAYNNISASYASMGKWDEAISAAQTAVRLKPDLQLAKNNLAWAQSQKKLEHR